MTHHPFEEWLFLDRNNSEEVLQEHEFSQLHKHLKTCASCRKLSRSWDEIKNELHAGQFETPRPGFVNRWFVRLEADRQKEQRRQALVLLGISISAAAILFAVLYWAASPWMQSPKVYLWTYIYQMIRLYADFLDFQNFLGKFLKVTISVIPFSWFLIIVGIASEFAVLWIVSLKILTNPRRLIS